MLTKENKQKSFFDPEQICGNLIEEDSFYHTLHKFGSAIISDEDFEPMYCEDNGRPSVPPVIMAKVLLLQRYDDVSDREAAARVRFDIRWKHALGVKVNWEGFHHTMLAHFRARLLAHDMEGIAFKNLNELAAELGLIEPDHLHAIDSSHILGAAQVKDTYELIRDAMAKVIEGVEEIQEGRAEEELGKKKAETYRDKQKADIDWHDENQRRQQLQVLVEDACGLLEVADGEGLPEESDAGKAVGLLEKILRQDIEFPGQQGPRTYKRGDNKEEQIRGSDKQEVGSTKEKQEKKEEKHEQQKEDQKEQKKEQKEVVEVSIKQGVSEDRMMSVVDPEMRHGRKSSAHRFNGYTGHIMEDLDAGWINQVMIGQANSGDGDVGTEPIQQAEEQTGYRPKEILGDIAYGTADNRVDYEELDVDLISPVPETTNAHGNYSKDEFDIDLEAGEVTCPADRTTDEWVWARDGEGRKVKTYKFDKQDCDACPVRSECTSAVNGRNITLNYHEEKLQEDRAYQEGEEFQEKYPRRAECERKVDEVMNRHGMRQSRYIGKRKTRMQMSWTAAVVNLKRLPALIKENLEKVVQQTGYALDELKQEISPKLTPT